MADCLLSLDAVSKSYWRGPIEVRVLTGASLDVNVGEFVAVWGKRGAGKTTLLRIAAGLRRRTGAWSASKARICRHCRRADTRG